LPDRSPQAAREEFLAPLRRALSCLTDAQIFVPGGKHPGDVEAVALSEDPLQLRSARIGNVGFVLGHQFKVIQDGRKSWRVTTTAYRYHLLSESGQELIGWHWHPATSGHPHLHVPAAPIDRRIHVPTGRVSIESVLRLLLTDLEVPPARDHAGDFEVVLAECEAPFVEHRRWHAWRRQS
jgi:hypothetical protein